jgi:hypothetical protein
MTFKEFWNWLKTNPPGDLDNALIKTAFMFAVVFWIVYGIYLTFFR